MIYTYFTQHVDHVGKTTVEADYMMDTIAPQTGWFSVTLRDKRKA